MQKSKSILVIAILIIAAGTGWLLAALGVRPDINWAWVLSLGAVGFLAFAVSGGIDKCSVVVGCFFLLSSLLSFLQQSDMIAVKVEIPLLAIAFGLLLLLARSTLIPLPRWFNPSPTRKIE
jgi:hypothetical protein